MTDFELMAGVVTLIFYHIIQVLYHKVLLSECTDHQPQAHMIVSSFQLIRAGVVTYSRKKKRFSFYFDIFLKQCNKPEFDV